MTPKPTQSRPGFSLMEMLVVVAILSILSVIAMPYMELAIIRQKEVELRQNLREIRSALDRFHEDHKAGRFSPFFDGVGKSGYPLDFKYLTEGVPTGDVNGSVLRYLRRIPKDPFAPPSQPAEEDWLILGYQKDSFLKFDPQEIYDVRSKTKRTALDGTTYDQW